MSNLDEICPVKSHRLIDLVRAAGVDVSGWSICTGGNAKAASNPKYCYEWAFVEPKKVAVFNLWHQKMEEQRDGGVLIKINERKFAGQRKGIERSRALRMDEAIQIAVKDKLPIRVIVLEGKRRDISDPKARPSKVLKRLLDPVAWTVTAYDWNTGECILTRGVKFVDQFSIRQESPQKPEKRDVSGQAFVRSGIVRSNVLARANGKCEFCGELGFTTIDGGIYLETHHIIPLCEDGLDTEANVAALCPDHHREAHHGINSNNIRQKLLHQNSGILTQR